MNLPLFFMSRLSQAIEYPSKPGTGSPAALTIPEGAVPATSGVLPTVGDLNRYLAEQQRSLAEKWQMLATAFPAGQSGVCARAPPFFINECQIFFKKKQKVNRGCLGVQVQPFPIGTKM